MTFSAPAKPLPVETAFSAPFWQAAREGRLSIQQCEACGRYQHPPGPVCPACGGRELGWSHVSGRGTVDTFTIVRRAFHPAFAEELPYVVARIALAEQEDLFLFSNILNCPVEAVRAGMEVQVLFEARGEGVVLPQFEPLASHAD